MSTEPMDAAMAAFRDRARATNLARADAVAEALASLRDGVLTEEARLTAQRTAHSIAGSAGTFGFGAASQLGRDLEALLDETGDSPDTRGRAELGLEQVARLREALTSDEPSTEGKASGDPTT